MTYLHRAYILAAFLALTIVGCGAKPDAAAPSAPATARQDEAPQLYVPYTPATQPAEIVTAPLPESPRDARPALDLLYSVEIWEIELPRDSVTTDETFWKRVDEQSVDLSTYDQLFKNGIRVGQLPMGELGEIRKLIEERKGKRTQIQGLEGKQVVIPIRSDVPRQVLFYVDRANNLIGRSYDRSENYFAFSFETTPRNPDRIRIALTPTVRAYDKKPQYTTTGGKADRELKFVAEESHYDTNLRTDLGLNSALIIAPSVEARFNSTLGNAFLIVRTPSEELERLIVIIPRAFKRDESAGTAR